MISICLWPSCGSSFLVQGHQRWGVLSTSGIFFAIFCDKCFAFLSRFLSHIFFYGLPGTLSGIVSVCLSIWYVHFFFPYHSDIFSHIQQNLYSQSDVPILQSSLFSYTHVLSIYVYIYTYTYIYTHTHTHVHRHTHIYIYIQIEYGIFKDLY